MLKKSVAAGAFCAGALFMLLGAPVAAKAEDWRVSSRMFELTYASAAEVVGNFYRTWFPVEYGPME